MKSHNLQHISRKSDVSTIGDTFRLPLTDVTTCHKHAESAAEINDSMILCIDTDETEAPSVFQSIWTNLKKCL